MTCKKCGTNNMESSTFCIKCGASLESSNLDNSVQNMGLNNMQVNANNNNLNQQSNFQQESIIQNINNNKIKSKGKGKLIIIAIIIVVLIVVLFLIFKGGNKSHNSDFDINYSPSFFFRNNDDKYALFDDNGNKLTDFVFSSTDDFVNGYSLVKQDDKYGIINSKGKMTVDFGKYEYITDESSFYKVRGKEGKYLLIDGSGKTLYNLENIDILTFIGEDTYIIIEDETKKEYKVLNYNGKTLVSFPMSSTDSADPSTNQEDGFVSVFYNNKNYILDPVAGKQIVSFDNDAHYCVKSADEDGKLIVLNNCVSWGQKKDTNGYKVIKNGKLYDVSNECENVYYKDNNLMCKKDYKDYLFDSNFNVGNEISYKAYIDNNTYAMNKEGSSTSVDFYKDNKVVKNVQCRIIEKDGYMNNGIYVLRAYYSKECGTSSTNFEYYNTKGERLFGKSFYDAESFDENGLAVANDGNGFYLMDTNGKKVSDEYKGIVLDDGYYVVTNNNLKGLLDKNGKVLADCIYSKVQVMEEKNNYYAEFLTSDSKYILYNLQTKSEIITSDSSPSTSYHYFSIKKDGKTQYYTYNGKMFYES